MKLFISLGNLISFLILLTYHHLTKENERGMCSSYHFEVSMILDLLAICYRCLIYLLILFFIVFKGVSQLLG